MKHTLWDDSFWKHLHPLKLQAEAIRLRTTFCLGGSAFLLFLVLNLSGLLLAFFYLPLPGKAYASVADLTFLVPWGGFIRGIHFWAGQIILIALLGHMARVFYQRAYRPPREWNWLVGLALLLLTFAEDFSGYVLRWDMDTFSAAQVATALLQTIPGIGPWLYQVAVGGRQIGEMTLVRFYLFHCLLLPGLMFPLIFYHFWRIRKDGLAGKSF
jgi:cytochrome b6